MTEVQIDTIIDSKGNEVLNQEPDNNGTENINEDPNDTELVHPEPGAGTTTDLWSKDEQGYDFAFRRSLKSPYMFANAVYFAYAIIIITIDVNYNNYPLWQVNQMYLGANLIHLTNALLYVWVWWHEGFRGKTFFILCIPELLNCCEASLYITSSTYYPDEDWNDYEYWAAVNVTVGNMNVTEYVWLQDPISTTIQNIEITASIVAMVAALGWTYTWYLTYRRIPNRGFTMDDPDMWALLTIIVGDVMYIVYNAEIINDRTLYGGDYLYVAADWVFVVNSWFYVACSMRDAGWFWELPTAGRPNFDSKWKKVGTGKET